MGIYVQTYAKTPRRKNWPWAKSLAHRITEEARIWSQSLGIEDLFREFATEESLSHFTFYPLNESLRFEVEAGQVSIGLKTSSVGAGYHAAFIDLCDHLESRLGLEWQWNLSNGESGDETSYVTKRDFSNLKALHFEQGMALLNHISGMENYGGLLVNCDTDLIHNHNNIAGPRGYITQKDIELFVEDQPTDIYSVTEKLFTWPNQEIDQTFWLYTLEGLLWHEASWRPLDTENDRQTFRTIKKIAEKLSHSKIPQHLSEAIAEYENIANSRVEPNPDGVGYKKRRLQKDVIGPWKASIPGYYWQSLEDENTTCVFYHDHVSLRFSSLSFKHPDGKDISIDQNWPESLSDYPTHQADKFVYRIPDEPEVTDDGWWFAMGSALAKTSSGHISMLNFSVTIDEKNKAISQLSDYFKSGIIFSESN